MAIRGRIVVALVGKRHYELKVRPVGDCKAIFSSSTGTTQKV
jgi:hypothetical protein